MYNIIDYSVSWINEPLTLFCYKIYNINKVMSIIKFMSIIYRCISDHSFFHRKKYMGNTLLKAYKINVFTSIFVYHSFIDIFFVCVLCHFWMKGFWVKLSYLLLIYLIILVAFIFLLIETQDNPLIVTGQLLFLFIIVLKLS